MIRFKDVTKVVLVLALCFGFAGVSSTICEGALPPMTCAEAQKNYINSRANCLQAIYIKKEYEKCANSQECDHSVSEEAANELDRASYCAKADEAKKFVKEFCVEKMMDELKEEAVRSV
ncbi:MAG: hypothetical protein LE180_00940 [Endomicrobium sp.]|uniref:hypothetical protein n=1 Tax=Candidatus Endomicrobiellum pyrsonymphae TaxID=1408203 RepID=UPI0035762F4D|nr:hypothetical protein [Endomicrobium sp.]